MTRPAESLPFHGEPPADDRQFVTALARGLEVLRCFSASRPELGAQEIALRIGLPQPTVWRLCHTLARLGYLVPGSAAGKLRVGAAVLALGAASLDALQYQDIVRPHLARFARRYPAAVILAQQHQLSMIYVLRCDGDTTFVMNLPTGSSVPLFDSIVGRVGLLGMTAARRAELIEQGTRLAPSRLQGFASRLEPLEAEWREHGFVTSVGELNSGVSMVALPLCGGGTEGPPAAAPHYTLLCGGPSFALSDELLRRRIGPDLVELAREIRPALPRSGA